MQEEDCIECEIIDLRTLLPWDRGTVGGPSLKAAESATEWNDSGVNLCSACLIEAEIRSPVHSCQKNVRSKVVVIQKG